MRRQAESHLGRHPAFRSTAGTAERTTLPDRSVDLITVGQALHWFDGPAARREFKRILKPDAMLATIWNQFDGAGHPELDDWFMPRTTERRSLGVKIRERWDGFIGGARSAASAPMPGDPGHEEFERTHRRVFDSRALDGRIEVAFVTHLVVGQPRLV